VPVAPSREEIGHSLLRARRSVHNLLFICYQAQIVPPRRKRLRKNFNSDDHFHRSFSPYPNESQARNPKKGTTMNPLTQSKKIRILPLLILGVICASVTAAHAQNLYVSVQTRPSHAILEFTPSATQSIYASGLLFPRGLAFDSIGNLFAAETVEPGDRLDIGRVLKFNVRNHVSTVGSAANFFFEGLAVDIAGNTYVMANDDNSPTAAGTIFKFTPDGERIVFGSVPSQGWGLAFD